MNLCLKLVLSFSLIATVVIQRAQITSLVMGLKKEKSDRVINKKL